MSKNERRPEAVVATNFSIALCTSNGVLKTPQLSYFTGAKEHRSTGGLNLSWQFKKADLIVDWGCKRHVKLAVISKQKNIPILSLEDGFIRSLGLGVEGSRSLSIVSDWSGIYYDATRPSDLENILEGFDSREHKLPDLAERSKGLISRICEQEISKYNHAPSINLGAKTKHRILLIDQTVGDHSISAGMASAANFETMLSDALKESVQTGANVLIKTHPDVIAGKKQAYLGKRNYPDSVRLIAEDCNPISLLKQVDDVRVVTSQMGFEACMLGLPVTCYGQPFYSGWGITQDKQKNARRTQTRSITDVFSAAYLLYPTYFHPENGEVSDIETVLNHIELQKHYWNQNQGHLICVGFDRWKHSYVKKFLKSPNNKIEFTRAFNPDQLKEESKIIVWGNNISQANRNLAKEGRIPLLTMEDGFIRSAQLGKYGTAPRSLVLDSEGIYFDPTQSSDLESVLERSLFTKDDELLANSIRLSLIEQKISKYNVGDRDTQVNTAKSGASNPAKKIILVPGQVNTDVSILKGCGEIKTNIGLLKAVREANPDAHILYKPHPDVVSGNINEEEINYGQFADQIESQANIHLCLEQADEVHTMTSLVGFEALLQNKVVYCYGSPFYSGWGLTIDKNSSPDSDINNRRTRKLNLLQLISGALVKYPRYIDLTTGEFLTADQSLRSLSQELANNESRQLSDGLISRWGLKIRHGGLGVLRNWFDI